MKESNLCYIKWLLPVLFIVYYSNIALFMHVHLEEGTMIVHSHLFPKTTGDASHQHQSLAEILFLHQLSTVSVADGFIYPFEIQVSHQQIIEIACKTTDPVFLSPHQTHLSLRGPPYVGLY